MADTPDCKMFTSSLARVFGPIIIGHSRPNPDVELTLKETKKQAGVILLFTKYVYGNLLSSISINRFL